MRKKTCHVQKCITNRHSLTEDEEFGDITVHAVNMQTYYESLRGNVRILTNWDRYFCIFNIEIREGNC